MSIILSFRIEAILVGIEIRIVKIIIGAIYA